MDEKYVALDVKKTDGGVDRFYRQDDKDAVTDVTIDHDKLLVWSGNDIISAYAAHGWMSFEWVRAD